MEIFDHPDLFTQVSCQLYGRIEEVAIASANLLWKPTGDFIRFVFAKTHLGPIVLMCSDLQQDPIVALELYCARVRVETMFAVLKRLLCVFAYRFWSKHLPRHSRVPKSNDQLKVPSAAAAAAVRQSWLASERFVMLGAIAQGLLQLLALKYPDTIWSHFDAFLRTRSRQLPSEATVLRVVARLLMEDFLNLKPSATMQEIHHLRQTPNNHDETEKTGTKKKPRVV